LFKVEFFLDEAWKTAVVSVVQRLSDAEDCGVVKLIKLLVGIESNVLNTVTIFVVNPARLPL
jgi:hypothetical protein